MSFCDSSTATVDSTAVRENGVPPGLYPLGPTGSENVLPPGAMDEEEIVEDEDAEEQRDQTVLSKAATAPAKTTPQMIRDHEVSHMPFRDWCPFCVQCRGKQTHTIVTQKGAKRTRLQCCQLTSPFGW